MAPDRDSEPRQFERYVAIGDSSTEGLDDPDGLGGYRGWANRLAEQIAAHQGSLLYANLGVRGRRTRQILDHQLQPALGMRPDLATIFAGTNDVVARNFSVTAFATDMGEILRSLGSAGATVVTFTLPDLTPVMPMARPLAPRVRALNQSLRELAASHGAILVDFAAHAVATDARLWAEDRLHANATGHARIAAALAHALGLPGTDDSWTMPLPALAPPTRRTRLAAEAAWCGRHLVPWLTRHLQGRSLGDGLGAKRPELLVLQRQAKGQHSPVL